MSIPHVDVKAQYEPLIPQLQEAFARTLESGRFIFGPEVLGDWQSLREEISRLQRTVGEEIAKRRRQEQRS